MSRDSWTRRSRKVPALLATVLVIAVAAVVALPAPSLASTSAGPGGGSSSLAALTPRSYGNVTTISFQGSTAHGEYFGNATYGFVVNVTETNTSATVSEFQVEETIGIAFGMTFCRPSCADPNLTVVVHYVAWEYRDAWGNVTNQATVTATTNGTTAVVPATGLLNASLRSRGQTTGSVAATVYRGANSTNGSVVYSVDSSASFSANSTVALTPALGLFPLGPLAPEESWTSTSTYTLAADWSARWTIQVSGPHGSLGYNGSNQKSIGPTTGTVTLNGSVEPTFYHDDDSSRALRVDSRLSTSNLVWAGPFFFRANMPDAWGSGFGGDWNSMEGVTAQVSPGPVELQAGPGQYGRLDSSSFTFSAGFSDSTSVSGANASGIAPATVPGAPMSGAEAASTSACLQSGTCSSSLAQGAGMTLSQLTTLIAGAGAVLVGVLATVLILGRRGKARP